MHQLLPQLLNGVVAVGMMRTAVMNVVHAVALVQNDRSQSLIKKSSVFVA
jgi:hypothetical protein